MASITIQNIEDSLKTRLKARAAEHGRSMKEEVRQILRESIARQRPETLGDIARELFGPKHGFKLDLPPRGKFRPPPDFSAK